MKQDLFDGPEDTGGRLAYDRVFTLWINGALKYTKTNVDNDTHPLEKVYLLMQDDMYISGTVYFDAFESWSDSTLAHERKYYAAGSGPVVQRVIRVQ